VYGETGTGKEQVARAIHASSPRAARPFVAVNSAAVSDELFDSEFFGHVRGSFTGAVATREGYVATAHGGTLFIDEVADLSPRGQVKLLRFLQEKEYRRVGETELRHADVRVIAATNVPLEKRVAAGTFREDLHFRLNILSLRLPPLRERAGDVLLLARFMLARAAEMERLPAPRLSLEAVRALEAYAWPGNVRELQAEMHRLVVQCAGRSAELLDLSPPLRARPRRTGFSLEQALVEFERDYVAQRLSECGGHKSRAAEALGITRQGLGQKLKRLGL
jgi:two-component system response regulator HydG